MTRLRLKFISLFLLLFLASCKKGKSDNDFQFHIDYFPIVEGRYVIYEVTEIEHDDDLNLHDTTKYWLKTVIGSVYEDNEGRFGREFLRYTRNDLSANWQLRDTWTTILAENRLELVEENQRVVKLLFAPSLKKEWNMNVFNTQPAQTASYVSVHESFVINGTVFDSTVAVEQANFFSLVDLRRQNEVYAKGVGLVSKYYKDLTIENFDSLNVKKGEELYYNCSSFGIE